MQQCSRSHPARDGSGPADTGAFMLAYLVCLVFVAGGLFGFMRVFARDGEQWPRPYALGAVAGMTAALLDLNQSGLSTWWVLPLWPVVGLYGGGAVGLAGGAIGNVVGGLSKAARAENPWSIHRRSR